MHGSLLEARQRRPRAGATWVHAELGFSSASRLALALLLGGLAWQAFHFDPARSATGFVSHTLCSGAFVSGLNPGGAYADTLKPMAMRQTVVVITACGRPEHQAYAAGDRRLSSLSQRRFWLRLS